MHVLSPPHFLIDCLSIILIDLLLAGDNALVIAMVVRSLPAGQRRIAISCGAALAVVLRVTITFLAAQLLAVAFVRLIGGAFVLWIAVKVLVDAGAPETQARPPQHVFHAMALIILADLTMSTDNVLAVAGASHGSLGLILFGLALSIPFVVFSSTLLSVLMDKYPVIVQVGAAVLGKVGVEMMLTDPFIGQWFRPGVFSRYSIEAAVIAGILIAGKLISQRMERATPAA